VDDKDQVSFGPPAGTRRLPSWDRLVHPFPRLAESPVGSTPPWPRDSVVLAWLEPRSTLQEPDALPPASEPARPLVAFDNAIVQSRQRVGAFHPASFV